MTVDYCLINPNNRTPAPFAAIEPPLWLGLTAMGLIKKDKTVAVVDAEAEGLTVDQTVHRVKDLHAKQNSIVVMGANPSVSSTPKMPVTEALLTHFKAKLTGLHPIAMRCPNTIKEPFEGLPHFPYVLMPPDKYRAHNWHCLDDLESRSPYAVIYTSLNCPFNCPYCNIHTLYGDRTMRYRKMHSILNDFYTLANRFHVRNVKIWDELFTLDAERVEAICDYLIREHFGFNIWAYARVDTVNQKMLDKMKQAGINWLCYGFESASNGVRKQSAKQYKDSQSKKAIDMTRQAGINILANFLFGLPGDTDEGMQATYDMAVRENFEYVNFYVALPYPGSEWYEKLIYRPNDWSSFSQFSPNICADKKVVAFRDRAFRDYFNRPEYLDMIQKKFGAKAESHIKEMVQWQIRS